MSRARQQSGNEDEVREIIARDFEPVDNSRQAVYHEHNGQWPYENIQRTEDGVRLYQDFGMTPFHRVLEQAKQADHPVYRYPEAFLNAMIHVDDADIWALEEGNLDRFQDEPYGRQKVMEWLADNPRIVQAMDDGGTDVHAHSKPGKGKTSFGNVIATVRNMEVNNETVLWMLTLDELEVLPLAPYMTVFAPKNVSIKVEAKPKDYTLPSTEVELEDIFRKVIRYESPEDIFNAVAPGACYGVLPDPYFRECERITTCAYNTAWEAEEPKEVTPLLDFVHAVLEVRAKEDLFLHQTSMIVDEAGDLLPKNPRADPSDTNRKVNRWPDTYGKARKKNLSVFLMSHSLKRVHEDVLEKERWFLTLPQTPKPRGSLAGIGDIPIREGQTRHLDKGEAVLWNATNFSEISWMNPYREFEFNGEVSISYPEWEEAKP